MVKNVVSFKTDADEKIEMSREKENQFYGGLSKEHLLSFIQRMENLIEAEKNLKQDIREVFAEAKGSGFDVKIMKRIIRERATDDNILLEEQYITDVYRRALGMLPLESYAAEREANDNLKVIIAGKEYTNLDLQEIMKAVTLTEKIIEHLKTMHHMGGFRTHTEADEEIAEKFVEMKLLKQPNKNDNLFMLTAKAEKLVAGK